MRAAAHRRASLRGLLFLVAFVAAGLLLSGCDNSLARTPRASEAWSKGLPLGLASLNNRPALAADQAGSVFIVWASADRDLRFVQLDDRASLVVERSLTLPTEAPQQPQMVLDEEGRLHLAWFDRKSGGIELRYARLTTQGDVLLDTIPVSVSELRAGRLAMILEPLGQTVELLWSDTSPSRPGCFHAAIDREGEVTVAEEVLVPEGLWPAAQVDRRGYVHLAWRQSPGGEDPTFHYAVYDPQLRALGPVAFAGEPVTEASLLGGPSAGGSIGGPWVGLDADRVYLAWTVEYRPRGLLQAFTFFQTFLQPELASRAGTEALSYDLPEVTASAVHVRAANPALTSDPIFLRDQPEQQALACYTEARAGRNAEQLQSAVVDLQVGQIARLEVVSASSAASLQPALALDGRGYRHMAWIETAGFERYRVIYASTAPQVQEVLNRVTAGEVLSQALELGFGALTLIGFLPLLLISAVPAFLVVLVYFLATQHADLDQGRAPLALAISIVVHVIIKLSTAGGALDRLSTGSLLQAPWLIAVARWVVPVAIPGLAVLIMRFYGRRADTKSIFAHFFVFVLVDAVLFTLVYLTPLVLLG